MTLRSLKLNSRLNRLKSKQMMKYNQQRASSISRIENLLNKPDKIKDKGKKTAKDYGIKWFSKSEDYSYMEYGNA